MRSDQVPQDDENFYDGNKRALYAKDAEGIYKQVLSKGWKVETYFTSEAIQAVQDEINSVLEEARNGKVSPLAVHMTARQMTPKLLAETVRCFTFQVKRHLRPSVFSKLSEKALKRYADALNMSVEKLKTIP